MGKNIHITKTGNQWKVLTAGAEKASALFDTQKEAIERGTEIAQNRKSEILIHGRDGKIRERNTFGNDPFPPRG